MCYDVPIYSQLIKLFCIILYYRYIILYKIAIFRFRLKKKNYVLAYQSTFYINKLLAYHIIYNICILHLIMLANEIPH